MRAVDPIGSRGKSMIQTASHRSVRRSHLPRSLKRLSAEKRFKAVRPLRIFSSTQRASRRNIWLCPSPVTLQEV